MLGSHAAVVLGQPPVTAFVAAARSDPNLWSSLTKSAAELGPGTHLLDQEFLCQGFSTSNRSPFVTVRKLFRLAAHGKLAGAPRVSAQGFEAPSSTRWLDQAYIDLSQWDLLTRETGGARVTPLGRVFLDTYSPSELTRDEPDGAELSRFSFRFYSTVERHAFDRPPEVWRAAKQQADRMVVFATDHWPRVEIPPSSVSLLDFLSCAPLKVAGGGAVDVLRWRDAWAAVSTLPDWSTVSQHLSEVQGRLSDSDGRRLGNLLHRYFRRDGKGSPRAGGLTYDAFRFLLNVPGVDEPAADVPTDVKPITTRQALVKVRQRSEPDRLKALVQYKCQLCGGAIRREGDNPYVEAAHLRPFAGLTEDGIPGNYLITCPNHHKVIDLGTVQFTIPSGPAPTEVMVRLQELDGSMRDYRVTPIKRQVDYGFFDAVAWRIKNPATA